MLSISFNIDPSVSKVVDENVKLAEYMKDQFLTIDIYDADSRFIFATAKLPMYELMRQTRDHVVVAKEVEASAPDSPEFRCSLQIIMDNQGKQDKEQLKIIANTKGATPEQALIQQTLNQRETRLGQQPSQQMSFNKKKY